MIDRVATQTAGPLERFNTRNAIPALSALIRVEQKTKPSPTSYSPTKSIQGVDLPHHYSLPNSSYKSEKLPEYVCYEPIEGLQEHSPILLRSWVTRTVFAPALAAAAHASEPAWPPPITQTSNTRLGCVSERVANLRQRRLLNIVRTTTKGRGCSMSQINP